jgi:hypothetical protein
MKRALPIVLFTLLTAAPLAAQGTARRGLWGGFGLGYGSLGCLDGCDDRLAGFSGIAMIGGTPSPTIRIGGGAGWFYREENGATLRAGSGLFVAQMFPGEGDFFIQGGVGGASVEVEAEVEGFSISTSDEGGAFLIGLGYDVDLGESGSLSIVPFANWTVTTVEGTFEFFQVGFGLVWN